MNENIGTLILSAPAVVSVLVSQLAAAGAWIVVVAALNPTIVAAVIGVLGQLSAALLTWYLITRGRKNGDK